LLLYGTVWPDENGLMVVIRIQSFMHAALMQKSRYTYFPWDGGLHSSRRILNRIAYSYIFDEMGKTMKTVSANGPIPPLCKMFVKDLFK
jgi:hypothetical protein